MTAPSCRPTLPVRDVDDLLYRAAAYLTCHGWTPKGLYKTHGRCFSICPEHGPFCYPASTLGAIRVAVFGHNVVRLDNISAEARHTYTAAVEWLNTYLLAVGYAGQHASVFDWETAPARTRVHAIGALQEAAFAYRRQAEQVAA
ncbi:hypothetical protein FB565_001523 [Actinoplanes lutulentus]|uniref:Uncharacterized protein n=1 Tax=Actinoplanes lutulentus TaxID=1287878 RepID=A0A327ZGF1_9ACTN|nr:hypothetical protein [Actinoplanes lutulentus]MBB2941819.1 hypothetical protein [Actinoplanes lutulentus]RAK39738.1 hypothetical protein B0I29_104276 [Actinoplanes lutulentus]